MHEAMDHMLVFGVDTKTRKVVLHGAMATDEEDYGKNPVQIVIKALLALDRTEGDIELWINSPGGLVSEMFALYDVIRTRKNKVITVGFGEICSAACLPLVAGDKRLVLENSWFMSHEPSISSARAIWDAKTRLKAEEMMNDRWAELMAKHTAHTKRWWLDVHDKKESRELWLTARQMVSTRHRIADAILYGG